MWTGIGRERPGVIQIDGSQGEGGGQILRWALALGAISGVPIQVRGIRARRQPPGLQAQHLTAARALATISGAKLEGASIGSLDLTMTPGAVRPGEYDFDIGTAGSVALVLQAILMPLAIADGPSRVTLTGGTHVPWSPPADYLGEVLLPVLARMGVRASLHMVRWGFFPRGHGQIVVEVEGRAALSPLTVIRRTTTNAPHGITVASRLPRSVAERVSARASARLRDAGHHSEISLRTVNALDPGCYLFLTAGGETWRAGFSGLGEPGKRAEQVADDAVEAFLEFAKSDAGCDPHLADQLIVPLALAPGTSRLTTTRITSHLLTAVALVRQVLGCPAQVSGEIGKPGSVTIEGVGERAGEARAEPGAPHNGRREGEGDRPAIRKARSTDGPPIQKLLGHFAERGELLPRTLNEVYRNLRDFFVCEMRGEVVGVCALSLYWEDLAEIRSLAVSEAYGGHGLGTALVSACLGEAATLGVRRVFALTYRPGFFERLGFRTVDKRELPQKIWKDCIRCAKFTCCDEVALIRDMALTTPPGVPG